MPTRAAIDDFLRNDPIAFIGVSRTDKAFANGVYRELRSHGHRLVPVHPSLDEIAGDACVPEVASLPDGIGGAIVMVGADRSAEVVRACLERGVPRIWLHRGVGPSSVSEEAVALCREAGVTVVDGACPLMYDAPTGFVHRIHRAERALTGRGAR